METKWYRVPARDSKHYGTLAWMYLPTEKVYWFSPGYDPVGTWPR